MHTPRLPMLTTFGLGHLRPAPGTWGSLPPPAVAYLLVLAGFAPTSWLYQLFLIVIMLVFSAACVIQGDIAEAVFGKKDHGNIVADETAGQCIPLIGLAFVPAGATDTWWAAMLTMGGCFLAFRLFDIIKPPPARQIQKLPAGWGVLIDDLVAGVYALILVLINGYLISF